MSSPWFSLDRAPWDEEYQLAAYPRKRAVRDAVNRALGTSFGKADRNGVPNLGGYLETGHQFFAPQLHRSGNWYMSVTPPAHRDAHNNLIHDPSRAREIDLGHSDTDVPRRIREGLTHPEVRKWLADTGLRSIDNDPWERHHDLDEDW